MLGLQRADPFPQESCDFGEERCLVGPGCSTTGACYKITCSRCTQEQEPGENQGDQEELDPRRYQYLGQTGTSVHRRILGHLAKDDSVVAKHSQEYHQGDQEVKEIEMKVTSKHRLLLERLVAEGNQIARLEQENPGTLMNGRGEFSKSKQVRFEINTHRI